MKCLTNLCQLLIALSLLFPSFSYAGNNSWSYSKMPYSLTKDNLPNVMSNSKDATAYINRHGIKKNTKIFFVITDSKCKKIGTKHYSHFMLVNGNKELFRSYCLKNGFREMYSENGYILTDEFLNKTKVALKEIYPSNNAKPISQVFSAKGFKEKFYDFNRKK